MKRIRKYFLFLLLNIIISPINIYAETGSINGNYHYDDTNLSNVQVKLYTVATLNEDKLKYTSDFSEFTDEIFDLPDSKLEEFSYKLEDYIKENDIQPFKITETDSYGNYSFDDLEIGLYLLEYEDKTKDNYKYSSIPIILTVPYNNYGNELLYDVYTRNKVERVEVQNECIDCINNETVPYTYDDIVIYIIMFIGALILIIGLILYINFRAGKEGKK